MTRCVRFSHTTAAEALVRISIAHTRVPPSQSVIRCICGTDAPALLVASELSVRRRVHDHNTLPQSPSDTICKSFSFRQSIMT